MAKLTLDGLVEQLRKAYGTDLTAVVLYGSAAAGEHIKARSDYNVLVIVERLGMEHLRAAAAVSDAWGDAGNPPPLTLTVEEWRRSADIFPMEYADVLERHRVLFGTPPFEGVQVNPRDLRHQVEHEAMGKLLRFRQGIMAAAGDGKRQVALLEESLSAMMVLFRGLVRLHNEHPSADYEELSRTVASRVGLDAEPFARVVRHVRGKERLAPAAAAEVVAGYLAGLEQLVRHLDRFRAA